jgi:signal transduction histidine kinase
MKILSMRVRLMLMFMLVMMIVLGAFALLVHLITQRDFQNYTANEQTINRELVSIQIAYNRMPNKELVQSQIEQLATQINARILVMDHNQSVIADSEHKLVGQTLTVAQFLTLDTSIVNAPTFSFADGSFSPSHVTRIIGTDGKIMTFGQSAFLLDSTFRDSINHALLLAVLVAGVVAFSLTAPLSRAVLKPVQALKQATRRMEQGDFSQRVTVTHNDEMGELAHAFNTMAASLESSGQLHRNLVSDVAHELRTPLTNVRGYLEALQDQVIEPDPMVIASLHEETMLLSRLVTDLQDLTLAEAGQLHLQRAPVALEDIIANAVNGLLLQAKEKNLSLYVNTPADLPLVEADPQRVGQILRNLLSNSIKHTPAAGEISVNVRALQQEVEVGVQDTGEGIAAEHLSSLFKRFYRADPSRSRATGGTGLGLAIVEQLVHAHGGQVSVESQLGKGTLFTFTLPVALVWDDVSKAELHIS